MLPRCNTSFFPLFDTSVLLFYPVQFPIKTKLGKSDCTCKRRSTKSYTNPVGSADSLVVDAVAFLRQQGGVPVAVVGLVVAHGERLWRVDARGRELSGEVVL